MATEPSVFENSPGNWGQFDFCSCATTPSAVFELTGTYTPFNYCVGRRLGTSTWAAAASVVVDPRSERPTATLPPEIALGGAKQGSVYLINSARRLARQSSRSGPPCKRKIRKGICRCWRQKFSRQYGKAAVPSTFFLRICGEHRVRRSGAKAARRWRISATLRAASYVFVTGAAKTGPGTCKDRRARQAWRSCGL